MKKPLPLVLLPGRGCNHLLWQYVLPKLPSFVKPIIPDILSCTSVDEILETIAAEPEQHFALMGFSMGGFLAQAFYARYPERVSHLILLCCTANAHHSTPDEQAERLERITYYRAHPDIIISGQYLAHFVKAGHSHTERALQISLKMVQAVGVEVICQQMLATAERESFIEILSRCEIPRLVIGAHHDNITQAVHVVRLAEILRVTPALFDCGHMVPLEAPNELNTLLRQWFAEKYHGHDT